MTHLVRWFTELKDGDGPVRYVSLPGRVSHNFFAWKSLDENQLEARLRHPQRAQGPAGRGTYLVLLEVRENPGEMDGNFWISLAHDGNVI